MIMMEARFGSRLQYSCVTLIYLAVITSKIWLCFPANVPVRNTLYDFNGDVSILDKDTLKETVYDSEQVWFVQFYSSWCGHCVHFAPTWKTLAGDIRGWRRIAKIAAVNCAEDQNSKICSEYIDVGFPTLRLFRALQKNGTGDISKGPRDVTHLRQALIDYVSKQSQQQIHEPSSWPMLSPVRVKWLLNFFSRNNKPWIKFIAVVFEAAESYTGRELILDMSYMKDIVVVRVLQQELLINPLTYQWKVTELPSLFILKQNGEPSELWRSGNRESFLKALQTYIQETSEVIGRNLPEAGQKSEILNGLEGKGDVRTEKHNDGMMTAKHQQDKAVQPYADNNSRKIESRSVVYMQDLESTLIYSLKYEVGLQKLMSADGMSALKAYLAVLNKYFPGQPYVMNTLHVLQKLLQPHTYLSNEDWSKILNQLHITPETGSFLGNDIRWVGCQGSSSLYRGYPCGLWVLFHTLTVRHAGLDLDYPQSDSREVLHAMKGYIEFFFGCRVCSDNFAKESVHLESSVTTLDDSIFWLWRVHNQVNKRLAGDLSEDPHHPKIAFPSLNDCQKCHDVNAPGQWNNSSVLLYMKELYGVNNIDMTVAKGGPRAYDRITAADMKHVKIDTKVTNGYFNLGIDTTDISMCLLLYALCSVLLFVIYVYVKNRRKRKSFKYFF